MSDLRVTKHEAATLTFRNSLQRIEENKNLLIERLSDKEKQLYDKVRNKINILFLEAQSSDDANKMQIFVKNIDKIYDSVRLTIEEGQYLFTQQFEQHEKNRRNREITCRLMAIFLMVVAGRNFWALREYFVFQNTMKEKVETTWWLSQFGTQIKTWALDTITSVTEWANDTFSKLLLTIFVLLCSFAMKLNDLESVNVPLIVSMRFRQSTNAPNDILKFLVAIVIAWFFASREDTFASFAVLMYGFNVALNFGSKRDMEDAKALDDLKIKRDQQIENLLKPVNDAVKEMLKNGNSHKNETLLPHAQVEDVKEWHHFSLLTNVLNSLLPLAKPCAVSALDKDMPVATCISEISRARLQQAAVLTPLQQLM